MALDFFLYRKLQLYGISVLKRVLEVKGTYQFPTRNLSQNYILFPSFRKSRNWPLYVYSQYLFDFDMKVPWQNMFFLRILQYRIFIKLHLLVYMIPDQFVCRPLQLSVPSQDSWRGCYPSWHLKQCLLKETCHNQWPRDLVPHSTRTYLNPMKKKHLWVCLSKPYIVVSHGFMLLFLNILFQLHW